MLLSSSATEPKNVISLAPKPVRSSVRFVNMLASGESSGRNSASATKLVCSQHEEKIAMMSSLEMPLDLPDAMPYDGLSYRVRNRCGHCVACGSPCASPTQGSLALSIGSVQVHTHTLTHKRSISISKPIKRARTHSLTLVRGCAGACVRARGSERMMMRRAKRPKLPSIAPPAERASQARPNPPTQRAA